MTANELADELVWIAKNRGDSISRQLADIVRQQQAELDAFKLNYYNTGYSLQLRDKDETIKQQQAEIEKLKSIVEDIIGQAFYEDDYHKAQAEIEALKKELKRYADEIGKERGNKALRNNEIGEILTKVLDDCGLLKKASEK